MLGQTLALTLVDAAVGLRRLDHGTQHQAGQRVLLGRGGDRRLTAMLDRVVKHLAEAGIVRRLRILLGQTACRAAQDPRQHVPQSAASASTSASAARAQPVEQAAQPATSAACPAACPAAAKTAQQIAEAAALASGVVAEDIVQQAALPRLLAGLPARLLALLLAHRGTQPLCQRHAGCHTHKAFHQTHAELSSDPAASTVAAARPQNAPRVLRFRRMINGKAPPRALDFSPAPL